MAVTVTIINKLTKVIGAGEGRPTFISPSGVTVPCTPIQEYISDMVTIDDGTLYIPAYNKGFQDIKIPYGAQIEFPVEDPREVNYWQNMFVDGATIYVDGEATDGIVDWQSDDLKYTYTKITFANKGTAAEPSYVPTWATATAEGQKVYEKAESPATGYTEVATQPDDWGTGEYFLKIENELPVNGATPTEG